MGQYLLDSNAFLYAKFEPQKLRPEAHETLSDRSNQVFVSLAALWEMGIKASNGKLPRFAAMLASGADGLREILRESDFTLLSVEVEHALAAVRLPQHHRDPFDRMMIAQAMTENLTLITNDAVFARYVGVRLLRC